MRQIAVVFVSVLLLFSSWLSLIGLVVFVHGVVFAHALDVMMTMMTN